MILLDFLRRTCSLEMQSLVVTATKKTIQLTVNIQTYCKVS